MAPTPAPTRPELARLAKDRTKNRLENLKSKVTRRSKGKGVKEEIINAECKEALKNLHMETLRNLELGCPLGKGTVDSKLTQLSLADPTGTANIGHEELQDYSNEVHAGLQKLLNVYTTQYLDTIALMKTPEYRTQLLEQVAAEKRKKEQLILERIQLDKDIHCLTADCNNILNACIQRLQSKNLTSNESNFECEGQEDVSQKVIEVIELE